MLLTQDDVRGIAEYARIALSDEELVDMTAYMNDAIKMLEPILVYADKDLTPTFHPIGDLSNVMRPDVAERTLTRERALQEAAAVDGAYVRVPSILGDGGQA